MTKTACAFAVSCACLLSACSSELDSPFLNYLDCRSKMTRQYEQSGMNRTGADMKAKAYCKKLFGKQ
jgi:hypothetical protein